VSGEGTSRSSSLSAASFSNGLDIARSAPIASALTFGSASSARAAIRVSSRKTRRHANRGQPHFAISGAPPRIPQHIPSLVGQESGERLERMHRLVPRVGFVGVRQTPVNVFKRSAISSFSSHRGSTRSMAVVRTTSMGSSNASISDWQVCVKAIRREIT